MAHAGSARVKFKHQRAHHRLKRAHPRHEMAPQEQSGRKTASFYFWERAHSTRGPSKANFTLVTRALAPPLPTFHDR